MKNRFLKFFTSCFVLLIIPFMLFAIDKKGQEQSDNDNKIAVAVITGVLGFLTAIMTSIWSYTQSKRMAKLQNELDIKMAKLQNELDIKKESDNNKFKYLLNYDTDTANQYLLSLKAFLTISQKTKDEVREMVRNYQNTFADERNERFTALKTKIIDIYSDNVFNFNSADRGNIAHKIKNEFVRIFEILETGAPGFEKEIEQIISGISTMQKSLHLEMDEEIKKIISAL